MFKNNWSSLPVTQRGWYKTEEEYYLLLFSVAVCGLRFISFSLEHCWCPLDRGGVVQLCWLFSYTFYHPFFYNGPIITYKDYVEQVWEQTKAAPELNCVLVSNSLLFLENISGGLFTK